MSLVETLTGDGPTVVLDVAEDFASEAPRQSELRLRLDQWVRGDVVDVYWDGEKLGDAVVRYCRAGDPIGISEVSAAAWLHFAIPLGQAGRGRHTVRAVLVKRHPRIACDILLTDVELLVRYAAKES